MTGADERPSVDVGVVTWNTADVTADALRRLLDTDQGCRLRLMVRDNASSDETPETLARLVPEAEVDVGAKNLGFAGGVNTLLARARAPWVFLLNSDAWPKPGAIRSLVKVAQRHPRAAAIAPRLVHPNGSLQHSTYAFPSLGLAAAAALGPRVIGQRRAERMMLIGAWEHDRPREVDWAIGAALLLRREAIEDIGPFNEEFFMYVEDLEWCWRARRRGWEIRFEPEAVVVHIGNVSGAIAFGDRRERAFMRNTYRFYRRERGAAEALSFRALNLIASGARYLGARLGGEPNLARYWRSQVAIHLARNRDEDEPASHRPR